MDQSSILSRFDGFVQSGVVLYDNQQQIVEHVDGKLKVRFLLTNALTRKPTIQAPGNTSAERDGSDISTTGFEMGHLGTSHVLVANKFALARPHIMVLTTDGHRRQYEPLDESDLTAAWTILNSVSEHGDSGSKARDYVVFYNCGRDGGCSRLHKHMQLIPTPPDSLASFLDADTPSKSVSIPQPDGTTTAAAAAADSGSPNAAEPGVPFHWFYHRFATKDNEQSSATARTPDSNQIKPTDLAKVYADLLQQAAAVGRGRSEHNEDTSLPGAAACPHNLIFTRRWMLVVPRRRGAVKKGIAANAIGMLGVIPVASREEMESWIELGPVHALKELGVPR